MKNKQNNFYIFINTDSCLWDWKFYKQNPKLLYNPQSIDALNYFIEELRGWGYFPHLIITSQSRRDLDQCASSLYSHGLDNNISIDGTEWKPGNRGRKIIEYLKDHECKLVHDTWTNDSKIINFFKLKPFKNYVAIDNVIDNLYEFIPSNSRIITNTIEGSLNIQMIHEYLARNKFISVSASAEM